MTENIHTLQQILPVPDRKKPLPAIDWEENERVLGQKFPADYKEFVETYGLGRINGDSIVYVPYDVKGYDGTNSIKESLSYFGNKEAKWSWAEIRDERLVCWGRGINGNLYCWKFTDSKFYIITFDMRGVGREDFPDLSFSAFLVGLLTIADMCEATTEAFHKEAEFESWE